MAITPNTDIYLIKCPLEEDNLNQLTFTSKTNQSTYFLSLPHLFLDNSTYQRKDNIIRYPDHIDNILTYNYVMYRNTNYGSKWFYAFITNMRYVSDGMTEITIKTDVFQTWQFDIEYKRSFVEREHVNDDTIGSNTVPENVELGELIINSSDVLDERGNLTYICMACSEVPDDTPGVSDSRTYNGIYSGLYYLIFNDSTSCSKMIKAFDEAGKADAIVSLFLIPTSMSFSNTWYTASLEEETDITFAVIQQSTSSTKLASNVTIAINSTLNGYSPINNKLKTYPYNYLYLTNNSGGQAIYHYEDFINNSAIFDVVGAISPGCSIMAVPKNYKKLSSSTVENNCYTYGLISSKYAVCSWNSDTYTNWLTQNSLNIGVGITSSIVGAVAGGVTGNVNSVIGGISGVANSIAKVNQASFVPDQAKGNTNNGDITNSNNNMGFTYYKMSIRSEYARIIDNWFSMYGYKINRLKVPNITGRSNWNYVKTIGCNIDGNIPQNDLSELKAMFNNGVTLWHNTDTFLDYSQSNTIV